MAEKTALKTIVKLALEKTINDFVIPYITDNKFIFPKENVYTFDSARISFDKKSIEISVEGYTRKDITNMTVYIGNTSILFSREDGKITVLSEDKIIIKEIPSKLLKKYTDKISEVFITKILKQ